MSGRTRSRKGGNRAIENARRGRGMLGETEEAVGETNEADEAKAITRGGDGGWHK